MNELLDLLQPYPFQKLRLLLNQPSKSNKPHINLSIGEPKHETPALIKDTLTKSLDGLSIYPTTQGSEGLREAIANWLQWRFKIPTINPQTQVLPINGSREGLFAIAQTVIDTQNQRYVDEKPIVIAPNPFYQIYEGAGLLAGAEMYYLAEDEDFDSIPEDILERCQLFYFCSPGNPNGQVLDQEGWEKLFDLSDQYNFVIAADECYSELYPYEQTPPIGALQASWTCGRTDFKNILMFSSLSKRSNVPGMRSGFVAGDEEIIADFLLYRTYHGCAMNPAVQMASLVAWQDEHHVKQNRQLYRDKYDAVMPMLKNKFPSAVRPEGGFYIWLDIGQDDLIFTKRLFEEQNVTVIPGQFLAREFNGRNPGQNKIRIALVAPIQECIEAISRLVQMD